MCYFGKINNISVEYIDMDIIDMDLSNRIYMREDPYNNRKYYNPKSTCWAMLYNDQYEIIGWIIYEYADCSGYFSNNSDEYVYNREHEITVIDVNGNVKYNNFCVVDEEGCDSENDNYFNFINDAANFFGTTFDNINGFACWMHARRG